MKVVSGKKQNSSFPPFSQSLVSRDALHLTFPKEKRPEDGVDYLHRHHIISLPTFSVDFMTHLSGTPVKLLRNLQFVFLNTIHTLNISEIPLNRLGDTKV